MAGGVRIPSSGEYFGAIEFDDPRELRARQTFDGLVVAFPMKVEVEKPERVAGLPMLTGVRATISAFSKEIGVAHDPNESYPAGEHDGVLEVPIPTSVVRRIETQRDGNAFELNLRVRALLQVLRMVELAPDPLKHEQDPQERVAKRVIGEPIRVSGDVRLTVEPQVWATMLNATGLGENVFVEIPLPPRPAPEWQDVWKALRTAREALNRGGATAWKTVVSECRVALERWQDIDAVDHGEGGLTASRDQREGRSRRQRHDALRWHAHQLAHYFQHNHAEECTRDDAVLVLSTLAGLLATRQL
ncbi:MAG: hypothetical protein IPM35_41205 [Myxococcales bacterium]|nr:hypothetical protein [Myxococcales bacterium]